MLVQSETMALGRLSKRCASSLYESSKGVLCGFLHSGWRSSCVQVKRHLLTEDVIKLQDFQLKKLAAVHLIEGTQGHFVQRFNEKLQRKDMILQDDLKRLLHLCQTPDDMGVAREAIYRYHSENPNVAYGEFIFGPLFMRLCFELGFEEMAAAAITDTTLKGFFNDTTSFNICINMLFLKGAYEDALEVLRTMQIYNIVLNKATLILAFGICYKLNTPESYKICISLIEESQTKGRLVPRHAYCFGIALALQQNDTAMAQCLFSRIINTEGRLCKNLKVLTLAMSGEVEEVSSVLMAATSRKAPALIRKQEFSQEVVDYVRVHCGDRPDRTEMNQILSRLEQAGQVIQLTLDDLLCHTPDVKAKLFPQMGDTRRTKSRQTSTLLNSALLSE